MSFELDYPGTFWMIIAGLFIISFIIQKFFYLFFYLRPGVERTNVASTISCEPVSVVICARNEADNLERNLPAILEQDYRDYEVIVVNDSSEDQTEEVLDLMKERYSNLRSTRIMKDHKFRHSKKLALTIGIKAARYEWVLLTDADCRPASPQWISQMQNHFIAPNEIVLGYGGYERKKGLLNMLVRYDTFFIAIQYFALALAGFPYMGVGRNLAYKRSLFFANKGFASHLGLKSGDDDLFINEVANKGNTDIELSYLAHTISSPPESWSEWINQKRRHLTTGFFYKRGTRFILGLEIMSRLIFYITFVWLVANAIFLPYVLAVFLVRLITSVLILNIGMKRLNEKNLLLFSPMFDIFVILFNIILVVGNSITQKRIRWR